MPVVSVRVSKDMKRRMEETDEDWADYIREMIDRRTRQREISEASEKIDDIRMRTEKGAFDAARSVREDRDTG
jgi:hypothetical protein